MILEEVVGQVKQKGKTKRRRLRHPWNDGIMKETSSFKLVRQRLNSAVQNAGCVYTTRLQLAYYLIKTI